MILKETVLLRDAVQQMTEVDQYMTEAELILKTKTPTAQLNSYDEGMEIRPSRVPRRQRQPNSHPHETVYHTGSKASVCTRLRSCLQQPGFVRGFTRFCDTDTRSRLADPNAQVRNCNAVSYQ